MCTKDAINDEVKELVVYFWTSNTRVSPNKKDVCQEHVGRKVHTIHPVHLLEQSQVGVFCNIFFSHCVSGRR